MKCSLCGCAIFEDAALYELNPETNRYAIMHPDCWQIVYDDLDETGRDGYQERKAAE